MNKFSDLNIKPEVSNFTGDKINISRILNTPVKVLSFKVDKSKKKENTDYLTLQIERNALPSGLYFLTLRTAKNLRVATLKIVCD